MRIIMKTKQMPWMTPSWAIIGLQQGKLKVLKSSMKKRKALKKGKQYVSKVKSSCRGNELSGSVFFILLSIQIQTISFIINFMDREPQSEVFFLTRNPVKDYSWGSNDPSSAVGRLARLSQQHYAELWMGVHPSGSSWVQEDGKEVAFTDFVKKKGYPLPQFLFKVLSIEKCLSIQVHPSKNQAQSLHKAKPQIYLDDNDKPEMFYVISQDFELFLGYISPQQFLRIRSLECFAHLSQAQDSREIIVSILDLPSLSQKQLYDNCMQELLHIHPTRYSSSKDSMERIRDNFSGDIGFVISFFLEHHKLKKGDCMYIGAGTPHAYIHGECLEIMKNSDNVCRLGLTPKLKDLEVIQEVLGRMEQCEGIKVAAKSSNWKGEEYSCNNLHYLILQYGANGSSEDVPLYGGCEKEMRFGIIVEGEFQISKNGEKCRIGKMGDVILLEAHVPYLIKGQKDGSGFMAIGWSTF